MLTLARALGSHLEQIVGVEQGVFAAGSGFDAVVHEVAGRAGQKVLDPLGGQALAVAAEASGIDGLAVAGK